MAVWKNEIPLKTEAQDGDILIDTNKRKTFIYDAATCSWKFHLTLEEYYKTIMMQKFVLKQDMNAGELIRMVNDGGEVKIDKLFRNYGPQYETFYYDNDISQDDVLDPEIQTAYDYDHNILAIVFRDETTEYGKIVFGKINFDRETIEFGPTATNVYNSPNSVKSITVSYDSTFKTFLVVWDEITALYSCFCLVSDDLIPVITAKTLLVSTVATDSRFKLFTYKNSPVHYLYNYNFTNHTTIFRTLQILTLSTIGNTNQSAAITASTADTIFDMTYNSKNNLILMLRADYNDTSPLSRNAYVQAFVPVAVHSTAITLGSQVQCLNNSSNDMPINTNVFLNSICSSDDDEFLVSIHDASTYAVNLLLGEVNGTSPNTITFTTSSSNPYELVSTSAQLRYTTDITYDEDNQDFIVTYSNGVYAVEESYTYSSKIIGYSGGNSLVEKGSGLSYSVGNLFITAVTDKIVDTNFFYTVAVSDLINEKEYANISFLVKRVGDTLTLNNNKYNNTSNLTNAPTIVDMKFAYNSSENVYYMAYLTDNGSSRILYVTKSTSRENFTYTTPVMVTLPAGCDIKAFDYKTTQYFDITYNKKLNIVMLAYCANNSGGTTRIYLSAIDENLIASTPHLLVSLTSNSGTYQYKSVVIRPQDEFFLIVSAYHGATCNINAIGVYYTNNTIYDCTGTNTLISTALATQPNLTVCCREEDNYGINTIIFQDSSSHIFIQMAQITSYTTLAVLTSANIVSVVKDYNKIYSFCDTRTTCNNIFWMDNTGNIKIASIIGNGSATTILLAATTVGSGDFAFFLGFDKETGYAYFLRGEDNNSAYTSPLLNNTGNTIQVEIIEMKYGTIQYVSIDSEFLEKIITRLWKPDSFNTSVKIFPSPYFHFIYNDINLNISQRIVEYKPIPRRDCVGVLEETGLAGEEKYISLLNSISMAFDELEIGKRYFIDLDYNIATIDNIDKTRINFPIGVAIGTDRLLLTKDRPIFPNW